MITKASAIIIEMLLDVVHGHATFALILTDDQPETAATPEAGDEDESCDTIPKTPPL